MRGADSPEEGGVAVGEQTAVALSTLILACFWMVVSADGMTASPRHIKGPNWAWLVSFGVASLLAGYSLWELLW